MQEYFIYGFFAFLVGIIVILAWPKKKKTQPSTIDIPADFDQSAKALQFLDRLIQKKIEVYYLTELLPVYNQNQIPENSLVKKIHDEIYLIITASITPKIKQEYLKFFTKKGIEMYIRQEITRILNKLDLENNNNSEPFRDLKTQINKIDKII